MNIIIATMRSSVLCQPSWCLNFTNNHRDNPTFDKATLSLLITFAGVIVTGMLNSLINEK